MTKETYKDVFVFKTPSDLLGRVLMVDFDIYQAERVCRFDLKTVKEYAYPGFFTPDLSKEELELIEQRLAVRFFNQLEE
jgi:hypothetical protein